MDDLCPTNQNLKLVTCNVKLVTQGKYHLILFSIFLILLLAVFLSLSQTRNFKGYQKTQARIQGQTYTLFIANTEEKRTRGLANITSIQNNEGMLFVFEKPDYYRFWMKDMKFPLDFIFINENQIVDMIRNVSPKNYPNTFTSIEKADKIIELNAGEITRLNLKKGANMQPSLQLIK